MDTLFQLGLLAQEEACVFPLSQALGSHSNHFFLNLGHRLWEERKPCSWSQCNFWEKRFHTLTFAFFELPVLSQASPFQDGPGSCKH